MNNYIKHIVEDFDFSQIQNNDITSDSIKNAMINHRKQQLDNIEPHFYEKLMQMIRSYVNFDKSSIGRDILIDRLDNCYKENEFKQKYKVKNKEELIEIINNAGINDNLNWVDVSGITDMVKLFYDSKFNGDISEWDVSNVTNMALMFAGASFNNDISRWNVSNVKNMQEMFLMSKFNKDISHWNVSNVTNMSHMFRYSMFNSDISSWKINPNCIILGMFEGSYILKHKEKLPQLIKDYLLQ